MEIKKIYKGIEFCFHKTSRFKTALMSISIVTPLNDRTSEKALLINMLARTTKDYPTTLEMNRALASLYGAVINPSISKIGDCQVLRLNLSAIDDRFSLDDESICRKCFELLCSCLFKPDITPEGFKEENLKREKRLLIEKIDGEKDDKRLYSENRLYEEMCRDEVYSINRLGKKEIIEKLTGKDIFEVWKDILLNAPVRISYVGSADVNELESMIKEVFRDYQRKTLPEIRTEFLTEAYDSKIITEKQSVKQGKLVIGYRAGMTYDMDNYAAIRLMTSIFGGGTFSKLFMNVREKMSLCYYCSARFNNEKGIITVASGVETENAYKALDAIRHELDDMRAGNFTDEVIADAKISITDSLRSISDSNTMISWWLNKSVASGQFLTPEQHIEMINAVSREEIILAANMITEDTVFILESEKEENGDE